MTLRKLRIALGAALLSMSALAFTPAAHATIPEGAVVLACNEVQPGFFAVKIFYQGQTEWIISDYCPL